MSEVQVGDRDNAEPRVIEARLADPVAVFYVEWMAGTIKNMPATLNDSLNRIVTMSTFMLGGGLYFLKESPMPATCRVASLVAFGIALAVAFAGLWPVSSMVQIGCWRLEECRSFKERVMYRKSTAFAIASVLLVVGVAITLAGMLIG
jgi:hypothetical protein